MIDIAGAVAAEAIDEETRDQPEPAHRAAGVRGVAAHYGDPMREQRTLATAVGLVDRSHRGVIAVPGEERISWLHTLTSQHLATLGAGQGTELLVLSPHGHVEQHAMVAEDGETTWLDTEPGATAGLLSYLERMRFFSKVEPRDVTADHALLSLVGPAAVFLRRASAAVVVMRSSGPQAKMSHRADTIFNDTRSGRWVTSRYTWEADRSMPRSRRCGVRSVLLCQPRLAMSSASRQV